MANRRSRFVWIAMGVISVPAILLTALLVYWNLHFYPSRIADFHPHQFLAEADAPFFYSIGDRLMNGKTIDPSGHTLLWGEFGNYLVSPDQSSIAIVANKHLFVVNRSGAIWRDIARVDSIYRDPKPLGTTFFRDEDFQWTRDSASIYLIRDQFYDSKGSQLFSEKGELWKYDLPSGHLQLVLKPFPAYNYFSDIAGGIYFSVPTAQGNLRLRYFDGKKITDVGPPGAARLCIDDKNSNCIHAPFYSFDSLAYEPMVLDGSGMTVSVDDNRGLRTIYYRGMPVLRFTRGEGLKGSYYCSEEQRSVYLPGFRYLFFAAPYCGNFGGQLLIDTTTAQYKTLPARTQVYLTVNSSANRHFHVSCSGIEPD